MIVSQQFRDGQTSQLAARTVSHTNSQFYLVMFFSNLKQATSDQCFFPFLRRTVTAADFNGLLVDN